METTQTPPDVTVVFPGAIADEISISMSPLLMQQWKQIAVAAALTEANATIERQKAAMAAMEQVNGQQAVKLREALDVIAEQSRRIALLEKPVVTLPPIIVPPVPPSPPVVPVMPLKPIISKTELRNIAGFCVTLGEEVPSAGVDATARALILMGQEMGMNCVRFYRNKDEVRADVKRSPDDLRNLYAFCRKHGMVVVADTVDVETLETSDAELKEYAGGLKLLGAALAVFNDANQYRTGKRKDGTPYPAGTLERMVARWRAVSDIPIMASVTAGARIEDYKPLFDFVEAQTFGKPSELDTFLDRGFDAYCLDAQQSVSLDYLRKAHDIILKDDPAAFWYYSAWDEKTLWTSMPQHTALIEKTVKAWNAARIVKAQPA